LTVPLRQFGQVKWSALDLYSAGFNLCHVEYIFNLCEKQVRRCAKRFDDFSLRFIKLGFSQYISHCDNAVQGRSHLVADIRYETSLCLIGFVSTLLCFCNPLRKYPNVKGQYDNRKCYANS
jgi:hypothetical protein